MRRRQDTDIEWVEKEVTLARFKKAQRLADVLQAEGVTSTDEGSMDDRAWDITIQAAQVRNASEGTKALTFALMRDREERRG